jgi:hypothetical protein
MESGVRRQAKSTSALGVTCDYPKDSSDLSKGDPLRGL